MANRHRVKVLNASKTTRLEQVTERINKEKQNLAKELRHIQNARLLFEANQRSRQEKRRRLSESLHYMQNSIRAGSEPSNSHRRSNSKLFSNSHSCLPSDIPLKNEEASINQQTRRLCLNNAPDRWAPGSWESNQASLDGVPTNQPMRRTSLPTVSPVTCYISSKRDQWSKEDLLNNTDSNEHMSKSLSKLVQSNWSLQSFSMESLGKVTSSSFQYKNKQPRVPPGGGQNISRNLRQESTEVNSRGTPPCCPLEEEKNEVRSKEHRVISGFVQESEDTTLVGSKEQRAMSYYTKERRPESSSEDNNKLKLPVIARSRSPSPLGYSGNGSRNKNEMSKLSRKISPSERIPEPLTKQAHTRKYVQSKEGRRGSGEQEVGLKVFAATEGSSSIKRKKAIASVELERLTRSSEELDQAMMSKFKRIGVGDMGHLVLKTAKIGETKERMESPGFIINTCGSKSPIVALSPLEDLAVTDLSDTPAERW